MTKNRIIAIALLVGFTPSAPIVIWIFIKGLRSLIDMGGYTLAYAALVPSLIVAVAVGYLIDANRRRLQNLRDGKPEWQGLE